MELDVAFDSCKDRVIFTHANAHAWPHLCATLAHDDVAGDDNFATVFFYAQTGAQSKGTKRLFLQGPQRRGE